MHSVLTPKQMEALISHKRLQVRDEDMVVDAVGLWI